jgi:hypothetical protein
MNLLEIKITLFVVSSLVARGRGKVSDVLNRHLLCCAPLTSLVSLSFLMSLEDMEGKLDADE